MNNLPSTRCEDCPYHQSVMETVADCQKISTEIQSDMLRIMAFNGDFEDRAKDKTDYDNHLLAFDEGLTQATKACLELDASVASDLASADVYIEKTADCSGPYTASREYPICHADPVAFEDFFQNVLLRGINE